MIINLFFLARPAVAAARLCNFQTAFMALAWEYYLSSLVTNAVDDGLSRRWLKHPVVLQGERKCYKTAGILEQQFLTSVPSLTSSCTSLLYFKMNTS